MNSLTVLFWHDKFKLSFFCKIFVNFTQQFIKSKTRVDNIVKVGIWLQCTWPKEYQSIESNIEKQWLCRTSRNSTASAPVDHTSRFVFDDKMINYQCILLNFSQLIKNLLFYNLYKICKHSFINIDLSHQSTNFLITPCISTRFIHRCVRWSKCDKERSERQETMYIYPWGMSVPKIP